MEWWTGSVTGSATFRTISGRPVKAVHAIANSAVSPTDGGAPHRAESFSWVPDASDPAKFVLYCWEAAAGAAAKETTITISVQTA
tara:strand:+ start:225 stop:479 length:255 start_codon:yes stop_codon:yes gene_type:complete